MYQRMPNSSDYSQRKPINKAQVDRNKESSIVLEDGMSKKEYLKLQKTWYKKLKDSGFEDIESVNSDGTISDYTKNAPGVNGRRHSQDRMDSENHYYTNASKWFWVKQWDNPIEKKVWELHAEGTPYRKIQAALAPKAPGIAQVGQMIHRLRAEMEIWAAQELTEVLDEEDALYQAIAKQRMTK